jgi:hypothetical protein
MNKYKILGYSNPLCALSVPLITIIKRNSKVCALFPDLTINQINISDESHLLEMEGFSMEEGNKFISGNEYSYLTHKNEVVIGDQVAVLKRMKMDLQILKDSENVAHTEMLEELILTEELVLNSKMKEPGLYYLSETVNSVKSLRMITTSRLKRNGERAKRVILQHKKNGSYKTDYRKNLYSNDVTDNIDLKRIYSPIKISLESLSRRYSEEIHGRFMPFIDGSSFHNT